MSQNRDSPSLRRTNQECGVCQDDLDQARIEAKRRRFEQYNSAHNKYYTGTPEERREIQFAMTVFVFSAKYTPFQSCQT